MKEFFNTNQCICDKTVSVGNRTFYIRKIHNTKTENQDEFFEYYLLDSLHQRIASYSAKFDITDKQTVLHLFNGYISEKDTKEGMKKLSILLTESFADIDDIAYNGQIVVDANESENLYSKFQHTCMRFDDACLGKMLYHINNQDSKQEKITIERNRVSKWYHLYDYLQAKQDAESQPGQE